MERAESRPRFRLPGLPDAAVLDGLRQYAGNGTGRARNGAEKDKPADIAVLRDCRSVEGHHPHGQIHKGTGGGFRTELLAGGSVGKAGPFHQLHAGAARVRHTLEDVPLRDDRTSRAVSEPWHHESEPHSGVTGGEDTYKGQEYIHMILLSFYKILFQVNMM